jgi:hypothetical protein
VTGYFYKSLGVTAQLTGNYNGSIRPSFASVHRYAYQFGPVYAFRLRRATAFAHALFGGGTQKSSETTSSYSDLNYTQFIWSLGGGLDFKVSRRLSIRAGQFDYEWQKVPVAFGSAGLTPTTYPSNGFRYSAGVVVNF